MTLLEQINTANSYIKPIYDEIENKGVTGIQDVSKNTGFLSSAISMIHTSRNIEILNDEKDVTINNSTYIKKAPDNVCYEQVNVQFNVQTIDNKSIDIDNVDNIEISQNTPLIPNSPVILNTNFYKQLEMPSNSQITQAPKMTIYTVPIGFIDQDDIVLLRDDELTKLYGIACILSNTVNDLSDDKSLVTGNLSYNYIDYDLYKKEETTYNFESCIDYPRLLNDQDINVANIDIASNIGMLLGQCKIMGKNIIVKDYFKNNIKGISKIRIYYNINLMIPDYKYTNNMLIPGNKISSTIQTARIQSVHSQIPAMSPLTDIIYDTDTRLSIHTKFK
ncbi:MAG: hypothetical protein [Wendovervirus sonii]|uniref:Uncharacterized protein n=1 Tax=phage Lak_Megaphage_Sonny TaxID=3109229 RepID=A0ABZ0Z3P9_9CAUD|nr:MAG: hypothetical protein [phage Lak_Megaphage_Sonny]